MKKLMFVVAAMAAGAAMADSVASANIVGFAKKALPANTFKQVGAQFEDTATGKLVIDNTFSNLPQVWYDDDGVWMNTAPQIQIVATTGIPTKYWLLQDGYVSEGVFKAGWCDMGGSIVDLEIVPGAGFWLKNADAAAQTLQDAGQVTAAASTDTTVPAGVFSIQANVYPLDVNLNDATKVSSADIVGVDYDDDGAWMNTAPQIQVVGDNGTPTKYWYLNDGYVSEGVFKKGWCDMGGSIVDVNIPAQAGFWLWAKTGAFTINWKK